MSSFDTDGIEKLLNDVKTGAIDTCEALERLKFLPFKDVGYAKLDLQRPLLSGFPEVILAKGKTARQVIELVTTMLKAEVAPLLVTKLNKVQLQAFDDFEIKGTVTQTGESDWMICFNQRKDLVGNVTIVTGGTADQYIAAETSATLRSVGLEPLILTDCGVAGLHRILSVAKQLQMADVVIVLAGMEGALASVVTSLTPAPVIAVPVSSGYGSSLEGISAMLSMQSSCVPGISTVGIDNGFGAAVVAIKILKKLYKRD
jgi:NCAIR mutase (PurE)-related protein